MSQIKQQISIQQVIRAKVIALLGITEQEYHNYLHQQGMAYLDEQLGGNVLGKELAENALYWKWWRNHWHDAEMEFVDTAKRMSAHERRLWYDLLHDVKSFEYKPQRAILQDAIKNIYNPRLIKHTL